MRVSRLAAVAGESITAHRRALLNTVFLLLTGSGVAAFGIAPLAPDAADMPRRVIAQIIETPDVSAQTDALSELDLRLVRNDLTRLGDTVDSLLRRLGVEDAQAAAFIRADPVARRLVEGRGGRMVRADLDSTGRLQRLIARYPLHGGPQSDSHFIRLSIERRNGRWAASSDTVPLSAAIRLASGVIRSSLYAATDEAGIPDAVASQMAEIFAGDIDFHRELQRGDTFAVVYEALTADDEPVAWAQSAGRVLAAEFVNGGQSHVAVWFRDNDGKGAYFDGTGRSRRRTFLASPLEFSRITSGFAMRLHPLEQAWRQHLGIDYSAPSGTPVRSVADGVVEFAGWQNGYGNVVTIQHGNDHQTMYAHLSSVDVQVGQRIEQGYRIGAVGATGWATGPHLHFEFRIKGQHQDPTTLARGARPMALDAASSQRFDEMLASTTVQLRAAHGLGTPLGE